MSPAKSPRAFALFEVLIGLSIFVVGILAIGRSVENCMNANALSAEEDRVRLILSNRMAEVQTTPGLPDPAKESKIDTGYGVVRLTQKTVATPMTEADGTDLPGINTVTLTAEWVRGGVKQSRSIEFYVYRAS